MPSLSGLHMWRTISSGHSSRASRAMSSWSGSRFLANSLSDFTLSLSVLAVIMTAASLSRDAAFLANPAGQRRQELQDVVDDSHVRHAEDRRLGILVDGDDERVALDARQVLERTADAAGQIDLGPHGLAGRAHLPRFIHPLGIDHRPRATHRRAHRLRQIFGDGDILLLPDAAADRNQHRLFGDIDIAGFGGDRLQIPAARRQGADFRRFIHDLPARRRAFRRPERARADIQHRAGGEVAADVRADLAAEFLADDFEPVAFDAFDIHHVRHIRRVHLDGKPRREIDAEVRMRNQQDAARAAARSTSALRTSSALG